MTITLFGCEPVENINIHKEKILTRVDIVMWIVETYFRDRVFTMQDVKAKIDEMIKAQLEKETD